MPGLGLGLGLNRQQQQRFRQAMATPGGLGQLTAQRPGIARKLGQLEMGQRGTDVQRQRWAAMNQPVIRSSPGNPAAAVPNAATQASLAKGPTTTPPQGNAATGAGKNAGGAKPPAAPAPAPAAPTFEGALTTQYGEGQPFNLQKWYGGNPLETARDLSNRELAKNLANIQSRYAASGGGTSGREAIAEGTAVGEATTGLGDVMAQRGLQARQADVQAALNAFLGAGQQQLAGQQQQLQYANQMQNLGNALNQIGALEQAVPNAGLIEQLLGLFSQQTGTGKTRQKQQTQSGFLGM